MTVGERIKYVREQAGISQVDFAVRMNVSKQTLYKYENNIVTNIPSDKIETAAKICNVSPAYLMGWTERESFESHKKAGNYEEMIIAETRKLNLWLNYDCGKSHVCVVFVSNVSLTHLILWLLIISEFTVFLKRVDSSPPSFSAKDILSKQFQVFDVYYWMYCFDTYPVYPDAGV